MDAVISAQRENSMACVSFPTCPLAMAEAERFLPSFTDKVEAILEKHGVRDEHIVLRVTGCPNGCGRAMLAELGLVGKAAGRYNLHLGGNRESARAFRVCSARTSPSRKFLIPSTSLSGAGRKSAKRVKASATSRCVRASSARCSIRRGISGSEAGRPLGRGAAQVISSSRRDNMAEFDLAALNALPKSGQALALAVTNAQLEKLDAEERVAWALENLPGEYVLSSSFGIQAAVSLHLVNQIRPDIPVILTDTGYLFPETYQFIDELTDKLKLNLKVFRATKSPAWQEARYGKLWEQGVEGIEKYNEINKVEPMNRALKELNAQTWFAGLRREQSGSRANLAGAGGAARGV